MKNQKMKNQRKKNRYTEGKEEEKQLVEKIGPTIKATVEDTNIINDDTEDDAVSRLELKEQEYLQEQEETKSEVLGEDNTSGIVEKMMERKMEEMMERKMNRMTQHANNQVAIVQAIIQDAELMITKLTTTLTMVTDQIEEANTTIQEIDKATTVIADFTDAAQESRREFTKIVEASKAETRKDAKAMKLRVKKLQQKLNNTKDKLMIEIQSTSPSTTHVEGTRNAIQNECHKGITAVRAEKERNMEVLNDKS
jgi:hypothetical protein